jgi:Glycoside-hydrolase family GH114
MAAGRQDGGRDRRRRALTVAASVLGAVALIGAGSAYAPPPVNAGFDYQIGEPYPPPAGVGVVSRDHAVDPAPDRYNVCYVNAFQTQTEAASWWKREHGDLLLRKNGKLVIDGDWNEILLDISTAAKRTALAGIVGEWIDECARRGYRAVEPDNLDSWTRSRGMLNQAHAVAYATLLAQHAHGRGLAIAQKNTVELAATGRDEIGFDFAVAEECADWDECDGYVEAYGDHVIVIEYDAGHFRAACEGYGASLSIVQRDRAVTAPGSSTYVFKSC